MDEHLTTGGATPTEGSANAMQGVRAVASTSTRDDRYGRARLIALASSMWDATTWISAIAPSCGSLVCTRVSTGFALKFRTKSVWGESGDGDTG